MGQVESCTNDMISISDGPDSGYSDPGPFLVRERPRNICRGLDYGSDASARHATTIRGCHGYLYGALPGPGDLPGSRMSAAEPQPSGHVIPSPQRAQDIIDLTDDSGDTEVIDLTGNEDSVEAHFVNITPNDFMHRKWLKRESCSYGQAVFKESGVSSSSKEPSWSLPGEEMDSTGSGSPALNSDQESFGNSSTDVIVQNDYSMGNCVFRNQGPSPIPKTCTRPPSPSRRLLTPTKGAVLQAPADSTCFPMASTPSRSPASHVTSNSSNHATIESTAPDKAWQYKLRYFQKPPVHHLFTQRLNGRSVTAMPIPARRMNIVNTTNEENFPQATLYFLFEFVSVSRYPKREILCHVVQSILLGEEDPGLKSDAYNLLMKVQAFHPAELDTVAWDWDLLTKVIKKKEPPAYLLFLQYVVQTLYDDFHCSLRRRAMQTCLAKTMLSCDKSFCNVKDVIMWLMEAVKSSCNARDNHAAFDCQGEVPLLQRMLSIAVDIDNSPACSSNKIAGFIFPFVIGMETRQEREMFLNSIDSYLLQAKILDLMFTHSYRFRTDLPLSVAKILYFIKHSTLDLGQQGPETNWQRWDEMLYYICLLFFSSQRITSDNLLTPVIERIDSPVTQMQNRALARTEDDVRSHLEIFRHRISGGQPVPPAIAERLKMLHLLLCAAVRQ